MGHRIPPTTRPKQEMTTLTKNSIAYNRTLFLEDNLPVMRGLDSDSIDLIATDPPFNKGVPAFTGTTKVGENVEFKDVWNWIEDVHDGWMDDIAEEHPSLSNVIRYANAAAGDDMGAFLCWMAVRVLEMHRVLKDTGSMYLHCDPTASHYLKAMMDAIFGRKQFRNEVVWGYRTQGVSKNWWPRKHDVILFYVKSGSYTFTPQMERQLYEKPFRHTKKDAQGRWYVETYRRDVWDHDETRPPISQSKERTGYPTQKPLALYKRIIEASSNPGDMVLDPFAGCATTCVAAEQLGREWIGIDIREEAGEVIFDRLQNEVVNGSMAWNDIVRVLTEAPERTDDGEPAAPELILEPSKDQPEMSTKEAKVKLLEMDGMVCLGCGWVPPYADYLQVDHRQPRTKKGREVITNFGLLCEPCNRKKSNKLSLRELQERRIEEGRMDADWYEAEGKWK